MHAILHKLTKFEVLHETTTSFLDNNREREIKMETLLLGA